MENLVTAEGLYLCGIFLYFVYTLYIRNTPKAYIRMVRDKSDEAALFSDKALLCIIFIVFLLAAFVWPVSTIMDIKDDLKGVNANE